MSKLMSPAQAEAVYGAMVALNSIVARAHVCIDLEDNAVLHIRENEDGSVQVFVGDAVGNPIGGSFEHYDSQNAFAAACGFDLDA